MAASPAAGLDWLMYRNFFGLKERPFDLTPNPRYLVLTQGHREALSNVTYGITAGKGITLLVGEAGTGKTTIIRAALERQPARSHCVHLQNPALTRAEFVEMLSARFDLGEDAHGSKTKLLLRLERLLRERKERGESTVLIIDEAQSVPLDLLEEIRLLANIETNEEKLLSVVLAGQPELVTLLNDGGLRQFKQRIALRCELRPLTMVETFAYVAGRLRAAGGVAANVFTQEAVTLLYQYSAGIPRVVSVIADNALLSGFALQQKPVTGSLVEEVCRDFAITRQQPNGGAEAPQPAAPAHATAAATATAPAAAAATAPTRVLTFEKTLAEPETTGDTSTEDEVPLPGETAAKRRRFLFF
jgi:general secretion pathway protein A